MGRLSCMVEHDNQCKWECDSAGRSMPNTHDIPSTRFMFTCLEDLQADRDEVKEAEALEAAEQAEE